MYFAYCTISLLSGPAYGGGTYTQASAKSGSIHGGPPRAPVQLARPGFGNQGIGNQRPGSNIGKALTQGRGQTGGVSISSSKTITVGGGSASASANSKSGK